MIKKTLIVFCIAISIIACNSGDSSTKNENQKETTESLPAEAEDPEISKGLELIAQSDCLGCHKVAEISIGPSYEAVAAKYGDDNAVIETLSQKIIKGGSGNWGDTPMAPHSNISEGDAKAMAKYILSLK